MFIINLNALSLLSFQTQFFETHSYNRAISNNSNSQNLIDFICTVSQAIIALTFAQYAAKPFFPDCQPPEISVRLLAALCLCK